jgi:uncharacterized membrane protein
MAIVASLDHQNMGPADRVVRSTLGGAMLVNGLKHLDHSWLRRLETGIGGLFLLYGVTGFDPLLKALGVSTVPGAEDNVLNQLKQVAPGQGINPMLTQQPLPRNVTRKSNIDETIADSMIIP